MVMKKPRGCACPTRESSIRYGSCDLLSSKLAYKNLNEDYVLSLYAILGKTWFIDLVQRTSMLDRLRITGITTRTLRIAGKFHSTF